MPKNVSPARMKPMKPGWGSAGWNWGEGAGLPGKPFRYSQLPPDLRPRTAAERKLLPQQDKEGSQGLHNVDPSVYKLAPSRVSATHAPVARALAKARRG